MLGRFKAFIEKENLCRPDDHIVLGVSGGMDSMVMAELFLRAGYDIFLAHCNFQLRGHEADQDEDLVRDFAGKHHIPFFVKHFDTAAFAESKGISIQMAARELRYTWFEELLAKEGFDRVATAHHLDDSIETFFINLLRASGVSGLTGIRPGNGKLIRPLLFAAKEDIAVYCEKEKIPFREDQSNQSLKYLRNRIRHRLLPELQNIDPNYRQAIRASMKNLKEADKVYNKVIRGLSEEIVRRDEEGKVYIPIDALISRQPLNTILFELIRPFGFTLADIESIVDALDDIPGKQFYSSTHRLLADREFLIIRKLEKENARKIYLIRENTDEIKMPVRLRIEKQNIDAHFEIPRDAAIACLDFDKLDFPLEMGKWKEGDSFQPLGMKGTKKLSDFFVDEKFSRIAKEETWVLRSKGEIVWVIGHRIDERFKLAPESSKACIIQFIN